MFLSRLLLISLLAAVTALAVPRVDSALNAASYSLPAMPNGGLAQGSMFVAFGAEMGPPQVQVVNAFPLPTTLAGTSVDIIAGGVSYNCVMVYSLARQVAAIVPSNVPVGAAQLRVRFNGQTSNSINIQIVKSSFGMFTLNQAGSGSGIFQNPVTFSVNSLQNPVAPGTLMDIWGTGLGPITAPDNQAPPIQNIDVPVTVKVGNMNADVVYKGRSACCAGIDQIRIRIPQVTGCYVPVVVIANGIPSNFTTMSVAPAGQQCTDPGGFTSNEIQTINRGDIRLGVLNLGRMSMTQSVPGAGTQTINVDTATGLFERFPGDTYNRAIGQNRVLHLGSCVVFHYNSDLDEIPDPFKAQPLDAGANIQVNGAGGNAQMMKGTDGTYLATGQGLPVPVPIPGVQGPFISPGDYTFTGPGGAQVGPFTTTIKIPALLNWTNKGAINQVRIGQSQEVTWTGGDATTPYVSIFGGSTNTQGKVTAAFFCGAPASAGRFTIPGEVTGSMPVSTTQEGVPGGFLNVGLNCDPKRFTANGLDIGMVTCNMQEQKSVGFVQ